MITGTSYFFDSNRDRMTALTSAADRLQQQVATGKRLLAPSQDSAGWQRLQTLVQAKADGGAYAGNIALAKAVLEQSDTTMGSVQTQLQRANELAIKANSGVLSTSDRAAIAEELETIVADLASLADTKDARGLPLFDADAAAIPVGDGVNVVVNSDPTRVFGSIVADLTTYVAQLRDPNADVAASSATAITAISTAVGSVAAQQGSAGARAARVELFEATAQDAAMVVEAQRTAVEDADLTTTIADLQKTMTILQATQASFSKLSELSLFNYLR